MSDIQPIYKHDCEKCVFLGQHKNAHGEVWDLYFCMQGTLQSPTVLARYGDMPEDYTSGIEAASNCPQIRKAIRLALVKFYACYK